MSKKAERLQHQYKAAQAKAQAATGDSNRAEKAWHRAEAEALGGFLGVTIVEDGQGRPFLVSAVSGVYNHHQRPTEVSLRGHLLRQDGQPSNNVQRIRNWTMTDRKWNG